MKMLHFFRKSINESIIITAWFWLCSGCRFWRNQYWSSSLGGQEVPWWISFPRSGIYHLIDCIIFTQLILIIYPWKFIEFHNNYLKKWFKDDFWSVHSTESSD